MDKNHKHTGTDGSPKLEARDSLENCPQSPVTKPMGGTFIDLEARAAISDLINKLKSVGITL